MPADLPHPTSPYKGEETAWHPYKSLTNLFRGSILVASHAADQRIDLKRPQSEPRVQAIRGGLEALSPEVEEEWSGPVVP